MPRVVFIGCRDHFDRGTKNLLAKEGVPVIGISDVTGFPEILDGRVKTLHPAVHSGLLAIRDSEEHQRQMQELGLDYIDLVVVNLYPFQETIAKPDVEYEDAIENIDIGGPTMLRSAAKTMLCERGCRCGGLWQRDRGNP